MEETAYTVTATRGGVNHTLYRSAINEEALEKALEAEGYKVVSVRYATLKDLFTFGFVGPRPPRKHSF